jgi:hypothetical protein
MVTGDNVETAKAIAFECGILNAKDVASETIIIEGKVFHEMSETAREEVADKITVTHLSLSLHHLSHVWSFQNHKQHSTYYK